MTLTNVQQELTDATATLMADSVVSRLFTEVEKFLTQPPTEEWFNKLLDVIKFNSGVEIGFQNSRSLVLAIIRNNWDNLPLEIRKRYDFAFMNFARLVTGKERSTIDGYCNVAGVWFINGVRPSGDVKIAERDTHGKPVPGKFKYVPFVPYQIDHSKLLIVTSRASRGEMTERLYEMLVDPYFTCEDLQRENSQLLPNGNLPDEYWETIGPGLWLTGPTGSVCIGELNWDEYEDNPAVKAGIDRLLKLLDIKRDDDVIFSHIHGEYTTL